MSVLVNLGCGARLHPEWINLDVSPVNPAVRRWDLKRGLPFTERSVDGIFCSHVLEHLEPAEGARLMRECARVLRSGGTIRFGVPDLEQLAVQYLTALRESRAGVPGASDRYEWAVMELLDQLVRHRSGGRFGELFSREELPVLDHAVSRWGAEALDLREAMVAKQFRPQPHRLSLLRKVARKAKSIIRPDGMEDRVGRFRLGGEPHLWMYDSYSLGQLISAAGFVDVREMPLLVSRIEGWEGYQLEGVVAPFKPDTVVVEGVAP